MKLLFTSLDWFISKCLISIIHEAIRIDIVEIVSSTPVAWNVFLTANYGETIKGNILINLRLSYLANETRYWLDYFWIKQTTTVVEINTLPNPVFDGLRRLHGKQQQSEFTHGHKSLHPRINDFSCLFIRWRGRIALTLLQGEGQCLCCRQNIWRWLLVCTFVAYKKQWNFVYNDSWCMSCRLANWTLIDFVTLNVVAEFCYWAVPKIIPSNDDSAFSSSFEASSSKSMP